MHLFDRLPDQLFRPLAGQHARRFWDLLLRLSEQFFAADCVPPYAEGYLHDQVTKEIERFLLDVEPVYGDESTGATPLNVRANEALARLVETGWLTEDRVGVRNFISMRPAIARFFETLAAFAEDGPQLVGGSIQLIHSHLKTAIENPKAQAAGFQSAALLCARLINSLNATTLRVRDLIQDLTQEKATPIFVKRFFSEHIEELYIRDFRQMRTENHPLMLRFEIIDLVSQLAEQEPRRSELLAGYAALPSAQREPAEELLNRDVSRFRRLLDVERFLERMDRVIDTATQRGLAYLGYRLKASERLETVIADCAQAATGVTGQGLPITSRLLSGPAAVADYRLRMPVRPSAKPARQPMRRRELTVRERAELLVRRTMIQNREMSLAAMRRYIDAHVPAGAARAVSELPVATVRDALALLGLLRLGLLARGDPKQLATNPLLRGLDFDVVLGPGRVKTDLFELEDFTVRRRKPHAT